MNIGADRASGRLYASSLLAGASAGSAILGWCALLVVARWASPTTYVSFAVVWALYYAVAGCVAGLQLEVTRWVVGRNHLSSNPTVRDGDPGGWGLLLVAVLVGSISALVVLASFPLWRGSLNAGWSVALLLAFGALTLTGLILVLGVLVAQRRWRAAAVLLGADSLVRLVATALAVAFATALPWYAFAIVSGSLAWVPLLFASRDLLTSVEWLQGASGLLSRVMTAVASTIGAAVLIAGLPWLYALTSSGAEGELSAGLIAGIVLFRSPVLVLAQGVRPVVLRELVSAGADAARHVRRANAVYCVSAVLLTAGAYLTGPALLRTTFGDSYVVSPTQAAGLALSAVVLAYAVHLSVALVALDQHRRGTEGWMVAVLVTLVALLLPIDGSSRLLVAAVAGPLVGVGYLSFAWVIVINRSESDA